jgi:hypothetical protein
MRKHLRDMIIELIPTILDGARTARSSQPQIADILLSDCRCALESIDNALQNVLSEERYIDYRVALGDIRKLFDDLNDSIRGIGSASQVLSDIKTSLDRLIKELFDEREVKLEVVFMPYKASMWDTFESIWMAAVKDPRCNAYVVPIPYYDRRKDRSLGECHCEGKKLPGDIPIIDSNLYDLSVQKPDIVYIHNPYDETNYVTSVDPRFYSTELKKHTDMLVYVPYYIAGGYSEEKNAATKLMAPGAVNADKIITQNRVMADFVNRLHPGKAVNTGSPKTDFVAYKAKADFVLPKEWEEKIGENKVILLNWSLGSLLSKDEWMDRYPDIIDILSQNKNITVLWRPHPLMEATLASMRPHLLEKYRELKNTVKTKQNVIIDDSADLDRAIIVSDAMVTDISSLIYKFLLTQKPLMLLTSSYNVQNVKETVKFFDYSSSYFWYMDEFIFDRANVTDIEYKKHREKCGVLTGTERRDIGLQEFVGVVLSGNDYLKEARIASIKKYAPDAGNCGSKINNIINNAVLGR